MVSKDQQMQETAKWVGRRQPCLVDLERLASYIWACQLQPFINEVVLDKAREWAELCGGAGIPAALD